jgi:hypothetical protein
VPFEGKYFGQGGIDSLDFRIVVGVVLPQTTDAVLCESFGHILDFQKEARAQDLNGDGLRFSLGSSRCSRGY